MILGRAHLPHAMFNLCEETLSRVKEYLNLGILQMSRYGLNLKYMFGKREVRILFFRIRRQWKNYNSVQTKTKSH